MKEAGFDHTDFSEEAIENFFSKFGLNRELKLVGDGLGFEFHGEGLIFITLYNPLTGVRSGNNQPTKNKGFTGYIGLSGDDKKVKQAVSFIEENADCGEYSNERDFI